MSKINDARDPVRLWMLQAPTGFQRRACYILRSCSSGASPCQAGAHWSLSRRMPEDNATITDPSRYVAEMRPGSAKIWLRGSILAPARSARQRLDHRLDLFLAPLGGWRDEPVGCGQWLRSEEHTSELQSLMRISYAVFCLKKTKTYPHTTQKSQN